MQNLKKISRESLKQVKGGLVKLENCVVLYGCPPNTRTCYWKNAGGGGDVICS